MRESYPATPLSLNREAVPIADALAAFPCSRTRRRAGPALRARRPHQGRPSPHRDRLAVGWASRNLSLGIVTLDAIGG